MFRNRTVFVLGAGASWHYGYPTGEGLVAEVSQFAERFASYCEMRSITPYSVNNVPRFIDARRDQSLGITGARAAWASAASDARTLSTRLRTVRPLVIDYFLGWNPTLQEIGRLMIAAVILQCEAHFRQTGANINRRKAIEAQPIMLTREQLMSHNISKYSDAWVRFIAHKLVSGIRKSPDLFNNLVTFITFNYDGSFENSLYQSLNAIDLLDEKT
jgi:hypothetical protein